MHDVHDPLPNQGLVVSPEIFDAGDMKVMEQPDRSASPTGGAPASGGGGRVRSLLPGLALAGAVAGVAYGVQQIVPALSPLLVAILVGVVLTNVWTLPAAITPGINVAAKRALRIGIVLLGLQLDIRDIIALGLPMVLAVVVIVAGGMFGTLAIGKALGVPPMQRLLIACGFSICGAAAVAGVEGAIDAEDEDVATAIGLVVLFGTLMIGVAPLLASALPLTTNQIGMTVGGGIHEVAQVVAAAGIIGGGALGVAVIVKLTRVLMLAPVVLGINLSMRRSGANVSGKTPPIVPLFIVGFLAAALLRTFGSMPTAILDAGQILQTLFLAAAMFALGTGVKYSLLTKVGFKPVVLGALSTVLVTGIALTGAVLVA